MIVQCDKCKTKFRIADEKVAASGVKVRCSRCAHVFMVQRDPTLLPPPPITNDVERALAGVGLAMHGDGGAPALPSFPESRPRAPMMQMTVPNSAVPSLVPSAATTKDAMIALGFAAAPGPEDTVRGTFDEESTATFTAASLLDAQNRFPEPEPISSFDELFGREPPTQVAQRQHPSNFETITAPSNPSMPSMAEMEAMAAALEETHPENTRVDNTRAEHTPAPLEKPRSNPMNDPLRPSSAIDTIRSSPSLAVLKSNPAMFSHTPPKSNPSLHSHTPSKSNPSLHAHTPPKSNPSMRSHTPPKSNPALAALAAAEVGPGDLTNPFFPPPTTNLNAILHAQNGEKNGGMFPPPDLGDIPGLIPPSSGNEDPFAGLDLEGPQYQGGDLGGEDSPAEAGTVPPPDHSTPARPLAKIELGRSGGASPFEQQLATTRVSTALLKDGQLATSDLSAAFDKNSRWPTIAGLVLGTAITIAALLGPADGDLSQLGPEDFVALVSTPLSEPIDTSVRSVEPKNAQVTLYPGKNGKPLLVVAGEAYNDGDRSVSGLEAVAMVLSGKEIVEQREGWVGLTLEEDALSAIGSPAELEVALADAARASKVPLDQRALEPGQSAPFMVIFPDPPPELEQRAFHVEFRRGTMSATRAQ